MLTVDTVFVAARASNEPSLALVLMGLASALSVAGVTWIATRSVQHGEMLAKIIAFTGADGNNGLAAKLTKIDTTQETLVATVNEIAVSVGVLQGRGEHAGSHSLTR